MNKLKKNLPNFKEGYDLKDQVKFALKKKNKRK